MSPTSYKMVAFGDVTVTEFPMILGDNPGLTSGGAPTQLDWKPLGESETFDLEIYEYMIKRQRHEERQIKGKEEAGYYHSKKLSVPPRAQILIEAGYTIDEIANAVMQVQEIQKQRAESIQANGLGERLQLLVQTSGKRLSIKGVLNSFGGGGTASTPKRKTVQARSA